MTYSTCPQPFCHCVENPGRPTSLLHRPHMDTNLHQRETGLPTARISHSLSRKMPRTFFHLGIRSPDDGRAMHQPHGFASCTMPSILYASLHAKNDVKPQQWHTPPFKVRRGSNLGSWQAQNESFKRLRGFQALDVMREAVCAALDVQFFTSLQTFIADAQRKALLLRLRCGSPPAYLGSLLNITCSSKVSS